MGTFILCGLLIGVLLGAIHEIRRETLMLATFLAVL